MQHQTSTGCAWSRESCPVFLHWLLNLIKYLDFLCCTPAPVPRGPVCHPNCKTLETSLRLPDSWLHEPHNNEHRQISSSKWEKKGKNGFLSKDAAAVIVGGWLFSVVIFTVQFGEWTMNSLSVNFNYTQWWNLIFIFKLLFFSVSASILYISEKILLFSLHFYFPLECIR